jgi:AAA domain
MNAAVPPGAEGLAKASSFDDWTKANPSPARKANGHAKAPRFNGVTASPIKFKTLASFCREYVPLAYAIEPILRASSLYTLTARTGHGKTAFLVIAALALATGRKDILGRDVPRGRVAFMTFENPDDVRMRFMIAAYALNILPAEIDASIMVLDARAKPEEVYCEIAKLAEAEPFTLVIVDTLAAFFDGDDPNDAKQGGDFMRRLRPLTKVEGNPAVLVAAHPIKNAPEDNLLPYGSGAVLNEVDGNLTLWKSSPTGFVSLHWQGKLRGLDFEPVMFRFENLSSPDLLDAKGRQFLLPVMRPCDAQAAEQRETAEANLDLALLRAMIAQPDGSQDDWGRAIGRAKGRVNSRLQKLKQLKLVETGLGRWRVTPKGVKEASNAQG